MDTKNKEHKIGDIIECMFTYVKILLNFSA
jgi:hypothetical protein